MATNGDDSLVGSAGDDSIDALGGNDTVDGGAGNDTLIGGTGDDRLVGGTGYDSMDGGADADTFVIEENFGGDTIKGGEGVTSSPDSDVIDAGLVTSDLIVMFSGYEAGTITDGADTITFSEIENVLTGGGDDVLDARNDSAGVGLFGNAGSDTIYGGSGADYIEGGDDADTFFISDGFGADTIRGGNGTTTGTDFDVIDLSGVTTPVTVTYSGDKAGTITDGTDTIAFEQIEGFVLTDGADVVDASSGSNGVVIDAGAGNDTIDGTQGADTLQGGTGSDVIRGWSGDDSIEGGDGADTLEGDEGNDTVIGGAGNDVLTGWDGDDVLSGGTGNDVILGQIGNDSLYGGAGSDRLRGGEGDDLMEGGDGADTFQIEDNFGNDTVVGGEGGTDSDTLDLSGLTGPVTLSFTDEEDGTVTDGIDTISFTEIETMILTDQNDSVDASAVWAGYGGDHLGVVIDALDGDDTVMGGRGGDTIYGGEGADFIDGGYGDDSLVGGAGNDTIQATLLGNDTIEGGDGDDDIDGGVEADVLSGGTGSDTIIGGEGADLIDGGTDDDLISAGDDNDTVDGGRGADTIDGGAGDDSLQGGGGDDVFVVSTGADTITDFNTGNSGTLDDGDSTNNDFVDLSGYYDHISELYADQADDNILNQSNTQDSRGQTTDYSDNTQFASGSSLTFTGASADKSTFTVENTGVVCFASDTMILTPRGEVAVERLRIGDSVITRDNGPQPLVWSAMRRLGPVALAALPHIKPVEIAAMAFGNARPLVVSPQHGVLLTLDGDEYLVRASHLLRLHGGKVRQRKGCRQITYWHLFFENHQVVFSNGIPSESFFPGPQAVASLVPKVRRELAGLVPGIEGVGDITDSCALYGAPARSYSRSHMLPDCLRAFAPVA